LLGGHARITTARCSSKYNTTRTVNKPNRGGWFIGWRWHQAFTPVLDGTWFKTRTFDDIFRFREITAFGIAAKIIQWISCRGWTVLRGAGVSGKNTSGGAFFGGTDCHPHCSKIERPWNEILTHSCNIWSIIVLYSYNRIIYFNLVV